MHFNCQTRVVYTNLKCQLQIKFIYLFLFKRINYFNCLLLIVTNIFCNFKFGIIYYHANLYSLLTSKNNILNLFFDLFKLYHSIYRFQFINFNFFFNLEIQFITVFRMLPLLLQTRSITTPKGTWRPSKVEVQNGFFLHVAVRF